MHTLQDMLEQMVGPRVFFGGRCAGSLAFHHPSPLSVPLHSEAYGDGESE